MNENRPSGDSRLKKAMAAGFAAAALTLTVPTASAAADPVNDYLDRVNALVERLNGQNPDAPIDAEEFNTMLNVENHRLADAMIAAKLPR